MTTPVSVTSGGNAVHAEAIKYHFEELSKTNPSRVRVVILEEWKCPKCAYTIFQAAYDDEEPTCNCCKEDLHRTYVEQVWIHIYRASGRCSKYHIGTL